MGFILLLIDVQAKRNSKMKLLSLLVLILIMTSCGISTQLKYGAISSASPQASEIGMQILKQGGNAADAAVAVQFALGVTEPAMSGIGGGTQVLIKESHQDFAHAINGSTISPSTTPVGLPRDSIYGMRRSTIPSTVKVLAYTFERYGSGKISWKEILAPSIKLAANGFSFGSFRGKVQEKYTEKLKAGHPMTSAYIQEDTDGIYKNDKLAQALQIIADEGESAFYDGVISESIQDDASKFNSWITAWDLENFPDPEELESVHMRYNGYDIYSQPEPCGGWVVHEILSFLESHGGCNIDVGSDVMIQALNTGHDKRKELAKRSASSENGETTHFSVMDANGMALSITSSINAYYGSGVANSTYGFLYNSYMDDFNFKDSTNLYALGPLKMAYSSMSPTMVLKDGKVHMVIGSPGSSRIISTVAQLVHYYTCDLVPPEEIHNIPRVHAIDSTVYFESTIHLDQFLENEMENQWTIKEASSDLVQNGLNAFFGGVHAIVWNGHRYIAIADPRRDGRALAR
jgi:gamma-glutamyltranspeptidase/glutathione hydrolase